MNKKTAYLLITMLIVIVIYSYFTMPHEYEIEGGSCYQGITPMIIRFFLTICGVLSLLSLIAITYRSKIRTAKILSTLSLILWFIGTLLHSNDNLLIGFKYFSPFLILNLFIVIQIFKNQKTD